jgi:hypothetical protein
MSAFLLSHRLTLRDLTREPTIYLIPECSSAGAEADTDCQFRPGKMSGGPTQASSAWVGLC